MPQNPLRLKSIHHVEFWVGNAKQAAYFYRRGFGFSETAYAGLETGQRDQTSYVLTQGKIRFLLTTPMSPEQPASEHLRCHGDGVRDIAFHVDDADAAFEEAIRRGARWVDPNVKEAQRQLMQALGLKVRIRDRKGKGKITIEYSTLEDFDRVVEMLSGRGE